MQVQFTTEFTLTKSILIDIVCYHTIPHSGTILQCNSVPALAPLGMQKTPDVESISHSTFMMNMEMSKFNLGNGTCDLKVAGNDRLL